MKRRLGPMQRIVRWPKAGEKLEQRKEWKKRGRGLGFIDEDVRGKVRGIDGVVRGRERMRFMQDWRSSCDAESTAHNHSGAEILRLTIYQTKESRI